MPVPPVAHGTEGVISYVCGPDAEHRPPACSTGCILPLGAGC